MPWRIIAAHSRDAAPPGTERVANQVFRTLSAMYRSACEWGLAPEGTNPCRVIAEDMLQGAGSNSRGIGL